MDEASSSNNMKEASSKYGVLSMRNIMIRKKLEERKRFDSADYAMQHSSMMDRQHHAGSRSGSIISLPTSSSSLKWKPSNHLSISTTEEALTTPRPQPTLSPAHIGLVAFREGLSDDMQMKGSNHKSTDMMTVSPAGRQITGVHYAKDITDGAVPSSKYGALSARNIILRRKLAEKTKFDSADYQMEIQGVVQKKAIHFGHDHLPPPPHGPHSGCVGHIIVQDSSLEEEKVEDVDMDSRRHLRHSGSHNTPMTTFDISTVASSSSTTTTTNHHHQQPQQPQQPQQQQQAPPPPPPRVPDQQPSYGKLCAANILIRKKLKERKRFDSADYSMENSNKKSTTFAAISAAATDTNRRSTSDSAAVTASERIIMMEKISDMETRHRHPHLDDDVDGLHDAQHAQHVNHNGRSHAGKSIQRIDQDHCHAPSTIATIASTTNALRSPTSRVAARNIFLQRKLAERKRFDSADYFSSMDAIHKTTATTGPR
jgi:hypothetical protein